MLVSPGTALTDTATDRASGVQSVTYYYCSGFSGACTSGTGTLIGTSRAPRRATSRSRGAARRPNGAYRLVAVGTDNVTNTSTASASIPVTVLNQAAQTITFTSTPPAAGKIGNTYAVTATASSGLTVAITLDASSTGCTRAGNTITFTAAGTCVIDANQAGNGSFFAAPQKQQSIVVNAGPRGHEHHQLEHRQHDCVGHVGDDHVQQPSQPGHGRRDRQR